MSLFQLTRVPEPEVMDDSGEVEAYASATAQAYLERLDDTFVEHALRLLRGRERGRALDLGTGPGQIVLKFARRLTRWKFIGVDRSPNMIAEAVANLAAAGNALAGRVEFQIANACALPFAADTFDLVLCNSALHHMSDSAKLLAEISRVARPHAAILLRDLCRPGRLLYPFHVRWHGRHYSGKMRDLYRDSVRASYSAPELQRLLEASPLRGARVFRHGRTHIGLERSFAS